jgi:hypothetical protein
MYNFLEDMRNKGLVTDSMLDLYLGVFIEQAEYDKLKAITVNAD